MQCAWVCGCTADGICRCNVYCGVRCGWWHIQCRIAVRGGREEHACVHACMHAGVGVRMRAYVSLVCLRCVVYVCIAPRRHRRRAPYDMIARMAIWASSHDHHHHTSLYRRRDRGRRDVCVSVLSLVALRSRRDRGGTQSAVRSCVCVLQCVGDWVCCNMLGVCGCTADM